MIDLGMQPLTSRRGLDTRDPDDILGGQKRIAKHNPCVSDICNMDAHVDLHTASR